MIFFPNSLPRKQSYNAPKPILGGTVLEMVDSFKLLGVTYDNNGRFKAHFKKCFEKAGKILGAIKLLGFRNDGLRPHTALKLFKLLVRPHFEYCLQVLPLKDIPVKKIEVFQRRETKSLLGLPMSTQNELLSLLIGLEPFEARIQILKLNYFEKLKTLDKKSLLYKISNFRYECIFSPLLDNFCHPDCTLASSVYEFHNLYHKFHMFKDFNFNISTQSSKRKTFLKKRVLEFHFNNDLKILPTKKSTQLFISYCKDV